MEQIQEPFSEPGFNSYVYRLHSDLVMPPSVPQFPQLKDEDSNNSYMIWLLRARGVSTFVKCLGTETTVQPPFPLAVIFVIRM